MPQPLPNGITLVELESAEDLEAVAEKYGFTSWRQLKIHLLTHGPEHPDDAPDNFLRHACLSYNDIDNPSRVEKARMMLATEPSLAGGDIHHAAAVGDVAAVRQFLDNDPDLKNQRGGWFGWEPILYACYSRLNLPQHSTFDVAKLLLERGANPNAYWMWGGQYRFTALTGVFGEGEGGPVNHPPHERCLDLARVLLEAGADPNDSQGLYNRMFGDGNDHLKLLLEFGLSARHKCNWLIGSKDALEPNPQQTLNYQLGWAVKHHLHERTKLLVEHGAELTTPDDETSFYERAMLSGNQELADYLVDNGAPKVELTNVTRFACACMSVDRLTAERLLQNEPALMRQLHEQSPSLLHEAVCSNRLEAVALLAELGADLDLGSFCTRLHDAAWNGHLEMAKLLVEKGANYSARDEAHFATPLQWASHAGQPTIVEYLSTLDIDIFDAIAANNIERIEQLLDSDPALLEKNLGHYHDNDEPQAYDWRTPLASAISRNRTEIVQLLLSRGADINLKDDNDVPLIDFARKQSTPEIVKLLEQA